ncbi:hypothetical protein [Burkholderia cepacia]|uniref:hypothetical protein n=1 Tax=Burkholderia cepacia TaxID=292 RepID=UPI002656ADAD|nr:hypothetical protein [Burkholderia cepacia]MDN7617950.1 hypothetical protein [Burkholderia cepacia]
MSAYKLLVASAVLFVFALSGYGAERVVNCPEEKVENDVFDASALVKNSRISIENGNAEYPLVLNFYRPTKDGCKKTEFARYALDGGAPTVESIFFMNFRGRANVFSIVSWNINNRGEMTYGRFYQVYAYYFDENDGLVENKSISEDEAMTGIEGYVKGRGSRFQYGTASDVKKYWRRRLR